MISKLWPLLVGFTIWALAFLVIYSLQALGCVWAWDGAWHRGILISTILLTLLALLAALVLQMRLSKGDPSRIERTGIVLTAIAIPTSVLVFAPSVILSLCT